MKVLLKSLSWLLVSTLLGSACSLGPEVSRKKLTQPTPDAGRDRQAEQSKNSPTGPQDPARGGEEAQVRIDDFEVSLDADKLPQAEQDLKEILKVDPNNIKANLWLRFMQALYEMKGILTRVRPLFLQADDLQKYQRYYDFVGRTTLNSSAAMKTYLLDGPQDLTSIDSFLDWADRLQFRLSALREYLARLRFDQQIALQIPKFLQGRESSYLAAPCREQSAGPLDFNSGRCANDGIHRTTLSPVDMVHIRQAIATYQTAIALHLAFRLNPSLAGYLDSETLQHSKESNQKMIRRALKGAAAGKLRNRRALEPLRVIGADYAVVMNYVVTHQTQICSGTYGGYNHSFVPLSQSIFDICFEKHFGYSKRKKPKVIETIELVESVLSGNTIVAKTEEDKTLLEFKAGDFISNPVDDIKSLAPFVLSDCGELVSINEQPLASYVAMGGINDWLKHMRNAKCQRATDSKAEVGK